MIETATATPVPAVDNTPPQKHPVTRKHRNRVGGLPGRLWVKMADNAAITFLNKGKPVAPFGATTAMVVYDAGPTETRLVGLLPQIDRATGVVEYADVKRSHNWRVPPKVGGRGKVLDPRFAKDPTLQAGDYPNGEWVWYAFAAHHARLRGTEAGYLLDPIPQLPRILVGYVDPADIVYDEDAIRELVLTTYRLSAEEFDAKSTEDKQQFRDTLAGPVVTPPGERGNTTGLYLVPHQYVKIAAGGFLRIFEDFTDLLGLEIPNPAASLSGFAKTITFADAPQAVLDAYAIVDQPDGHAVEAVVAALAVVVAYIREELLGEEAPQFSKEQLVQLVGDYHQLPDDVVRVVGIHRMEAALRATNPHLLSVVRPVELYAAAYDPRKPLRIANACKVQVFHVNTRGLGTDALKFSPKGLQRPKMGLNPVPSEDWRPSHAATPVLKSRGGRRRRGGRGRNRGKK